MFPFIGMSPGLGGLMPTGGPGKYPGLGQQGMVQPRGGGIPDMVKAMMMRRLQGSGPQPGIPPGFQPQPGMPTMGQPIQQPVPEPPAMYAGGDPDWFKRQGPGQSGGFNNQGPIKQPNLFAGNPFTQNPSFTNTQKGRQAFPGYGGALY